MGVVSIIDSIEAFDISELAGKLTLVDNFKYRISNLTSSKDVHPLNVLSQTTPPYGYIGNLVSIVFNFIQFVYNIQCSLLNNTFIITFLTINRFYNLGLYLTWFFSKTISMTEL